MWFPTSLLLTTFLSSASAQYALNSSVGSCADVHCPETPLGGSNAMKAECNVTNRTYERIGFRSFSTAILDDNNNLTWTLAAHLDTDVPIKDQTTEKDFYLGTPPSLELDRDGLPYRGCAVFIYNTTFGRNYSWDCAEAIGASCISSLVTQANTLLALSPSNATETTEESCMRVQRGMETFPTECTEKTNMTSWNAISAIPLTGKGAPTPPNSSANASSNCHPTLPKSNDLSLAFSHNETGVGSFTDIIITTFWSPDKGVANALSVPDTQLMCLWVNGLTDASVATHTESSASRFSISMVGLAVCVGLGVFGLI